MAGESRLASINEVRAEFQQSRIVAQPGAQPGQCLGSQQLGWAVNQGDHRQIPDCSVKMK
jgi:hypothetical protein